MPLTSSKSNPFKLAFIGNDVSPETWVDLLEKYKGILFEYHRFEEKSVEFSLTKQWETMY
jgi:hypothetical protein